MDLLLFGVSAAAVYSLSFLRSHSNHSCPPKPTGLSESVYRLLQHGRRRLIANMLDVGGFFGADIGGSLAKLVFFTPNDGLVDWLMNPKRAPREKLEAWREKITAVKKLAEWMLSRENYGLTGVRDASLAVKVDELGGTFHFVRCAIFDDEGG